MGDTPRGSQRSQRPLGQVSRVAGSSFGYLLRRRTLVAGTLSFLCAYRAFAHYDESRTNLDGTVFWLGLSLFFLAAAVWDGALPQPATWPSRVGRLVQARKWELVSLAVVLGFAVVMRAGRFGDFSPSGLITFEEHINGTSAYMILQGDRPIVYPFERYGAALSFLFFGETASAQRLLFVIAGLLTVLPFYALLREFVRPPAALFTTVLFVSAPILIDTSTMQQVRILAAVLFFYFLVRGTRTGSSLHFFAAGIIAALLSYEWDAFKPVPILGAGFLATLAVKRLAWPPPRRVREAAERTREMITQHWRPTVAFFGAAGIVLIPLLVTELDGPDHLPRFYIAPADRHQELRGSLLPDDWQERLKWAIEAYLPPQLEGLLESDLGIQLASSSPPGTPLKRLPMVDVVTAIAVTVGVVVAVIGFFRPYRLLFLPYFLFSMAVLAVFSDRYLAWRLAPLLPVGLILAAFAVEDVSKLASRLAPRAAIYGVTLALVSLASFAAIDNAKTWFEDVPNERELSEYTNFKGEGYALCDYLRSRGRDSFSYVLFGSRPINSFTQPHSTLEEQRRAFGDFLWICHDLEGTGVAAPQEVWPLRPIPKGAATLAFVGVPTEAGEVAASLAKALPSKPQPDYIFEAPLGSFTLVGYEFSEEDVESLQGLYGRYEATGSGTLLAERVDDVSRLVWDEQDAPPVPFTVRWQGVVYRDEGQPGGQLPVFLEALSDDPTEVTIDGEVSFSSLGEAPVFFPRPLEAGWHAVEVKVLKTRPSGSLSLRWLDSRGDVTTIQRGDLFPLPSISGWRHQRTVREVVSGSISTFERLDFEPSYASDGVIRLTQDSQVEVVSEKWSAVWRVSQPGEYSLQANILSGSLVIRLDDSIIVDLPPQMNESRIVEVTVTISPGEHRLEVQQLHDGGTWTGATIKITNLDRADLSPDISPF